MGSLGGLPESLRGRVVRALPAQSDNAKIADAVEYTKHQEALE